MLLVSLLHVIGLIAVQCLCSACCVVHVLHVCVGQDDGNGREGQIHDQ